MIVISDAIVIPDDEIIYSVSSSSKPGGQNVNRTYSRVTAHFDVANSPSLTDEQRNLLLGKLKNRITQDGQLLVSSQRFRSQISNRKDALERLIAILEHAFFPEKPRRQTTIPKSSKERRLALKRKRSLIKLDRSRNISDAD